MKLKIAQVGLGHLGELHCAALSKLSEVELAGVYDIHFEKSQRMAQIYGVKACSDMKQLMEQAQALVVAVPTKSHFEIVQKALATGKHVFVEKPIASSVAEAAELVELAASSGMILQVGHIERFNPAVRALAGQELQPMYLECKRLAPFSHRGTDVAVVVDLMIHDLDLVLHFVQSDIERIDASGFAVASPEIDIANARLQFANGCVANLSASRIASNKVRTLQLFQKNSYFKIDFLRQTAEKYYLIPNPGKKATGDDGKVADLPRRKKIVCQALPVVDADPLQMELQAFVQSVCTGAKPLVDGEDGKAVLAVAVEITKIIEQQSKQRA